MSAAGMTTRIFWAPLPPLPPLPSTKTLVMSTGAWSLVRHSFVGSRLFQKGQIDVANAEEHPKLPSRARSTSSFTWSMRSDSCQLSHFYEISTDELPIFPLFVRTYMLCVGSSQYVQECPCPSAEKSGRR